MTTRPRTVASQAYGFDTIGPAVSSEVKMAIVLDELARLIFMLSRNEKLEKRATRFSSSKLHGDATDMRHKAA